MKTVNKICQILATLFGLVSVVLFFTKFATFATNDGDVSIVGAVLAFGGKVKVLENEYTMAKSAELLFCFLLSAIGFLMSAFSFKSKGLRYAAPALGLGAAIYMLVIALGNPWLFIDARPLNVLLGANRIEYTSFVLLTAIALFLFAAAGIAYLLIDDYLEVAQSKGSKRTILKRIVAFFKDYKSEVKKIVWPGMNDVLRNTLIVLIMCLIVGAFIWLLDFGLGKLLEIILRR